MCGSHGTAGRDAASDEGAVRVSASCMGDKVRCRTEEREREEGEESLPSGGRHCAELLSRPERGRRRPLDEDLRESERAAEGGGRRGLRKGQRARGGGSATNPISYGAESRVSTTERLTQVGSTSEPGDIMGIRSEHCTYMTQFTTNCCLGRMRNSEGKRRSRS